MGLVVVLVFATVVIDLVVDNVLLGACDLSFVVADVLISGWWFGVACVVFLLLGLVVWWVC